MIIDIKDILTLDDGIKYAVLGKTNYNDKNYYYLVETNGNNVVKFCYQDNDELVEINDKILITRLLPLFLEKTKENLNIN